MGVRVNERHDPRRCAYCHDALEAPDPTRVAACGRCGAHVHLACWVEHGECPVLACAPAPGHAPRPVAWTQFVADADAWLALGAALDDAAWGPAADVDVERRARRRRGGSSWTSSAA